MELFGSCWNQLLNCSSNSLLSLIKASVRAVIWKQGIAFEPLSEWDYSVVGGPVFCYQRHLLDEEFHSNAPIKSWILLDSSGETLWNNQPSFVLSESIAGL